MSSHHWPHDGLPTPPGAMKGSRSKPGGLNLDCTSGSIAGAAPSLMPLHTTRTTDTGLASLFKIKSPLMEHSIVLVNLAYQILDCVVGTDVTDHEAVHRNTTYAGPIIV
ncbi:hypothetical protein HaLaN_27775 [Haematococcus lacustris]|uniref:Uncharacterized protein n=1 Tax=Haematococcus lacustris TaxID=44745 RepID=A0A6A0A8W5_HAELA|nr:hypothetical protein HaLaN_27775 [Haematococcus lacustris]